MYTEMWHSEFKNSNNHANVTKFMHNDSGRVCGVKSVRIWFSG